MLQRRVGCGGLLVGALGLACQTLSPPEADGASATSAEDDPWSEAAAIRAVQRALDAGVTLLDTADAYGPYRNELLLGRALAGRREQAVIATKCGLAHAVGAGLVRDGRPEHVRKACDGSLRRLGVDRIDLYQLHRVDPVVPIEETWGAMAELVAAGKVRSLGLCEVSVAQLRRAQHVFPVTSVRGELSPWATAALDGVLPWCRAHGVGFLAFAPLGRAQSDRPDLDPPISAGLRSLAARRRLTVDQVALGWVLAQGDGVVPLLDAAGSEDLLRLAAACPPELTGEELRSVGAAAASADAESAGAG